MECMLYLSNQQIMSVVNSYQESKSQRPKIVQGLRNQATLLQEFFSYEVENHSI